jgi:hypothetical protein
MIIISTHNGLPDGLSRDDALRELDAVGPRALKLSGTAFRLLKLAMLKCRDSDFHAGKICGMWDQPATIAAELGIERRVLDNAERLLEEKGFIARTWNLHCARSGRRQGGNIVHLAGINLAPLINGFARKVMARRKLANLKREACDQLRQEIASVWNQIRFHGNDEVRAKADAILPAGRKSRITARGKLRSLKADLEALLAAIFEVSGAQKTSDQSEDSFAPNILSSDSPTSCSGSAANPDEPIAISPDRAASLASDDYRELIAASGGPSWSNLIEASATVAAWHGISQSEWGRACKQLGREKAALCVLAIDRTIRLPKGHRYRRDNPAACLGGMVRKSRKQGFGPGRLLRAIQGFEDDAMRSAASPPPGREQPSLPGVISAGALAQQLLNQVTCKFTGEFR